jgi:hypothetical protein
LKLAAFVSAVRKIARESKKLTSRGFSPSIQTSRKFKIRKFRQGRRKCEVASAHYSNNQDFLFAKIQAATKRLRIKGL